MRMLELFSGRKVIANKFRSGGWEAEKMTARSIIIDKRISGKDLIIVAGVLGIGALIGFGIWPWSLSYCKELVKKLEGLK
jgi:hypothetical protein